MRSRIGTKFIKRTCTRITSSLIGGHLSINRLAGHVHSADLEFMLINSIMQTIQCSFKIAILEIYNAGNIFFYFEKKVTNFFFCHGGHFSWDSKYVIKKLKNSDTQVLCLKFTRHKTEKEVDLIVLWAVIFITLIVHTFFKYVQFQRLFLLSLVSRIVFPYWGTQSNSSGWCRHRISITRQRSRHSHILDAWHPIYRYTCELWNGLPPEGFPLRYEPRFKHKRNFD